MKKLFITVIIITLFIPPLFAQMDQPLKLQCLHSEVVKSEIRSMKDGKPATLVTTPVNQLGEHITGLKPHDFQITKGKKIAEILKVEELKAVESTVMRVLFMVDNSQSMSPYLDVLKSTLEKVIKGFSKAVRVSVLFFNEGDLRSSPTFQYNGKALPIVRLPYTYDKNRAVQYTQKMLVEPNLSRSTYLYDGVYATLEQVKTDTGKVDRSFAIVFSDGEDNASKVEPETILYSEKPNTTFYTIDYRTASNKFLEKLANETDGEHFIAKDSDELMKVFEKIANKIVAKGYKITYSFKAPPRATISSSTKELVMEEDIIRETFPLLNYIFFEQGSSTIPDRYVRLSSDRVSKFDGSAIEGGALDFYYSALNIIGSRMRKITNATITITGCINNYEDEKNNTKLATDRANAVRSYLNTIWGIEDNRMNVAAIKLPLVPSSSKDEDGRAENRRVEITCDNWEIMKPVTFIRRIASVNPSTISFATTKDIPEGLESYTLNIEQNNLPFDTRTGSTLESTMNWNWKNRKGEYPVANGVITYNLAVMDKVGDTFVTPKENINVREVKKERLKNVEIEGGITKEKISLILFEFDKADMGPRNEQIMDEFVYTRLTQVSNITISGYTDIIGSEEYNQTLSERRAKAVYDVLLIHEVGKIKAETVKYIGYGETNPIFNNSTPEGRFYNRTVSLLLEN